MAIRGYGSVGRAMRSQRIGQGFESPYLHQQEPKSNYFGLGSLFFKFFLCNYAKRQPMMVAFLHSYGKTKMIGNQWKNFL